MLIDERQVDTGQREITTPFLCTDVYARAYKRVYERDVYNKKRILRVRDCRILFCDMGHWGGMCVCVCVYPIAKRHQRKLYFLVMRFSCECR